MVSSKQGSILSMKIAPMYSLLRYVLFSDVCFSMCMFVVGKIMWGIHILMFVCAHGTAFDVIPWATSTLKLF